MNKRQQTNKRNEKLTSYTKIERWTWRGRLGSLCATRVSMCY